MPAIKYLKESVEIISTGAHHSGDIAPVRLKSGGVYPAPLFGFRYAGGEREGGQVVKLQVTAITDESGNKCSQWRQLGPDEFALGWIPSGIDGVYVLTDREGWPVVVRGGGSAQEARES
jgi:hypothetical protein